MKIGILTLPLHTNYGGILQAWALQTILERMGHEVKVINYPLVEKPSIGNSFIHYVYNNIKNRILRNKRYSTSWYSGRTATFYIRKNTNKFISKYIHNRFAYNLSDIEESEFDLIVVGSDQIWRKGYSPWRDICDSYLQFAKNWNIRRVAYAASFGKDNVDDYTDKEISTCADLIKLFDKVSVRECSGIELCRNVFDVDATQVLDPTLLLSKEDYDNLIKAFDSSKIEGDLFMYILDNNQVIQNTIEFVESKNNWKSFSVKGLENDTNANLKNRISKPVEQWLQGFRDSEAVITDSFHACVFSIIFNKPFLVFGNKDRGLSRFESLLSITGLMDRLVTSQSEAVDKIDLLKIAPNAENKLNAYKEIAFKYLSSI